MEQPAGDQHDNDLVWQAALLAQEAQQEMLDQERQLNRLLEEENHMDHMDQFQLLPPEHRLHNQPDVELSDVALSDLNQSFMDEISEHNRSDVRGHRVNPEIIRNLAPAKKKRLNLKKLRQSLLKFGTGVISRTVTSPITLLYYREAFKVGSREHFGIIDHLDEIATNQSFSTLWNGFQCVVLESGLVVLTENLNENTKDILNSVFIAIISYPLMKLKLDVGNLNFGNSALAVYQYAVNSPNFMTISAGIVASAITFLLQTKVNKAINTKFQIIRGLTGVTKIFARIVGLSFIFIPLFAISRRMQVNQCSFLDAFRQGHFTQGFGLYALHKVMAIGLNVLLNRLVL